MGLDRSQVVARIAEIDEKLAAAKQWGAYVSVLLEERQALQRSLGAYLHAPEEQSES